MLRRLLPVALTSALSAAFLAGAVAPPAAAATCGGSDTLRNISGTDYCFWYRTSYGVHTWSVPSWVTTIDVLVIGAGGNGRDASSSARGAAGGAAGKVLGRGGVSVVAGGSVSANIGRGGRSGDTEVSTPGRTFTAPNGVVGSTTGSGGTSGKDINLNTNSDSTSWTNYSGGSYDSNTSSGAYTYAGGGGGGAGGTGSGGDAGGTQARGGTGGTGLQLAALGFYGGSTSWVACGGGGGASAYSVAANTAIAGAGGSSCSGGTGAKATYASGGDTAAVAASNPGSGGGGGAIHQAAGGDGPAPGKDGKDGMVIIRYLPLTKVLSLSSGAGQQPAAPAPSGVALGTQPVVQLMNGVSTDPVSGVTVVASTSSSGCSLTGTTSQTTDASGVATFTDLALSRVAGSCTITFTDSGGTYTDVTSNSITVTAGPAVATNSAVTMSPTSLQVASPGNTSAATVQLKDDSGNALGASQYAAFGPYDVALSVSGAAGSVGAVTDNADGTYSATFTGGTETGAATVAGTLSLGSGATGTAGSLTSASVTMTPGSAAVLAIGTEPDPGTGGYSGQAFDTPAVVNVEDAFGNVVTNDSSTSVTASLVQVSGSGASSLGGSNPVVASSGVATFTNLAVTGRATDTYRLDFSASGLSGVSSEVFAIAREPQSVSWVSGSSGSKTFGDVPFVVSARALDASSAETGLPITFASSDEAVCSVSGAENPNPSSNTYSATVTVTGAGGGGGSCVVTASQAGDDDYAPASSSGLTFTVARAAQAGLSIFSGTSAVFGTDLTLVGGGGSGSSVLSWGSSSGPCTVTGSGTTGTLTPTGVGTCVVTLNRAADSNFNAASQVTQSVVIAKRDQVVAFTSLVPTRPESFQTYAAEFSSSLGGSYVPSVAVTAGNGTVCTAVDNGDGTATVRFLASGTCTLTATENGDTNTNSGSATQTIVVDSINQNITFAPIADQVFGVPPIQLTATASSGRPVTYTSSTTSVCTVGASSGLLTIIDKGVCSVTVSRAADAQYAAANSVQRSFTVAAALATAPHVSSVSSGDTTITTSFVAPGFTGAPSESIAGYELTATPTSGSPVTQPCSDTTAPLVCTMTGLANGTDYRITVAAVNSSGVGAASSPSSLLRPATAANAVTGAYAVPDINGTSVHLYWDQLPNTVATLGGGTFTRYDVYVREVGGTWPGTPEFTTSTITATDNNFTGLTTGQSYEFKIVAITSANSSELTGNTTIVTEYPSTVPGAVTELTLTETSDTSVIITWEVPDTDGGAEITAYDVAVPGLRNCAIDPTTDANRCVFTNLSLGRTYVFSVSATNRMGEGAAATVSVTTPPPPANDAGYGGPAITDQTVPSAVLTGAASWMVTENGIPVQSSRTPNAADTGWIISGTGFTTEVITTTAAGAPIGLGAGGLLIGEQGGWIDILGTGYRPDTLVKAFLIPANNSTRAKARTIPGTLYVGSIDVNTRGNVNGRVYIPTYATAGQWVLQLVGQENLQTLRTTNLAITVTDTDPDTSTFLVQRSAFFTGGKATLSKNGKKKLRSMIAGIPAGATIDTIDVIGVSVVKTNTTGQNLRLAAQRADVLANYLTKSGLSGTIDVTIRTQITYGTTTKERTASPPVQSRTGKPLTTVNITYTTTN